MVMALALAGAVFAVAARGGPAVDQYSVSFDTPSVSSLGSMPLGNGRTTANTWVNNGVDILFI